MAQPTPGTPQQPSLVFGTGSDGNVTIAAGTTTLLRDTHYNNLTINGTGVLKPNGFRVFVKGTLDLSAAPTGAIIGNPVAGNNAAGLVAGAAVSTFAYVTNGATIPVTPLTVGVGGTGNTTTGANATQSNQTVTVGTSARGGSSGAGGNGVSAGAASLSGQIVNSSNYLIGPTAPYFVSSNGFPLGTSVVCGGLYGAPGAQGGGDGTVSGGGGGGPAGAPASIFINAFFIQRGSNTNVGIIQSKGAKGGDGGSVAGNAGGGGGAGGSSGGLIYITTAGLLGSTITSGLDVSGGAGGTGGNGTGTGKGGTGGMGGGSGAIGVLNLTTGTFTGLQPQTTGTAATTASTTAGTSGTSGITTQMDF